MSCINNIDKLIIPNDIIVMLGKIHELVGRNDYYKNVLNNDINRIIEQTVERDAFFLANILELNISDTRMRLIITKASTYRTKEEAVLYYLKESMQTFQNNPESINLDSTDILNMINYVFVKYTPIRFDAVHQNKRVVIQNSSIVTKKEILDNLNEVVEDKLNSQAFDEIALSIFYFIDFFNINPFTAQNKCASMLVFYALMLKCRIDAFKYISFFELLHTNYESFVEELKECSLQWSDGFPRPLPFIRFICKLIIQGYEKTNNAIKAYSVDRAINKGDNIENTIEQFPEIFTKEEIRYKHPYVSESTINRALTKMRDEGKIRPLGKGRSAKWIRITGDD